MYRIPSVKQPLLGSSPPCHLAEIGRVLSQTCNKTCIHYPERYRYYCHVSHTAAVYSFIALTIVATVYSNHYSMATSDKVAGTPDFVPNPFIKKRNLEWRLSPPPLKRQRQHAPAEKDTPTARPQAPTSAAIEAGDAKITDHTSHFSALLAGATLSPYPDGPRLPIPQFKALFNSSLGNTRGAHFVVHQHDHPVAGTHYDLRLQINGTSSASWAIMYGLPGNPNSARLGRNATETRVHCLWNHLIETASASTGSLLIWDTGTYAVLPLPSKHVPAADPGSQKSAENDGDSGDTMTAAATVTEQEKLQAAFAARKIRLRLNGTRLPAPYVINLRLTTRDDVAGRSRALSDVSGARRKRKARRVQRRDPRQAPLETSCSSNSGSEGFGAEDRFDPTDNDAAPLVADENEAGLSAMERELRELEDDEVRRTNAYPGAANTIGSIHQRRWFLSLDRAASGFVRRRSGSAVTWEREAGPNCAAADAQQRSAGSCARLDYPFYVRGPDHERSVVTGRLGADILRDEHVKGFVKRKGWHPVLI